MENQNTKYISIPEVLFKKLSSLPENTREAVDYFIEILMEYLHPIFSNISMEKDSKSDDWVKNRLKNNIMLCSSLLSKYVRLMKEIFKKEAEHICILQESRNWVLGRIVWVLKCLDQLKHSSQSGTSSVFIHCDGDEFVLWIDKALDVLENVRNYFENDLERNDLKVNHSIWRIQCTTDLFNLHHYVRDTVTAAMKICQSCLTSDQNIIIARCHVVFRELKKLLTELTSKVNINIDKFVIKVDDMKPKEKLHYPTVRLLCDVLRDAMYNLEATSNRAVLALVLFCMTDPLKPLKDVVEQSRCQISSSVDESVLEAFDIHMERVIQVGTFSLSCSADEKRIFMLKNCLVNLEDLEVQMIPSILSDPQSIHTNILVQQWTKEMNTLKFLVFLIIDPVALMDLVMEKFRLCLIKLKSENMLEWNDTQHLIGLGMCIFDYIRIYKEYEPASLPQYEKIFNFVADLQKVLKECSVVCQKFVMPISKSDAQVNETQPESEKIKNQSRVLKRLKLLYAILLNISQQVLEDSGCFDDGDNISENNCKDTIKTDVTYTHRGVIGLLGNLQNRPTTDASERLENETCSLPNQIFSRSTIVRIHNCRSNNSVFVKTNPSFSSNFYKKHDGACMCNSASFFSTICANEEFILANISEEDMKLSKEFLLESILQEKTRILRSNNNGRNLRTSLRKTLLMNKVKQNGIGIVKNSSTNKEEIMPVKDVSKMEEIGSNVLDANTTDWHITEILEQLSHLSNTLSLMNLDIDKQLVKIPDNADNNYITKLNAAQDHFSSPKYVWNIKISDDNSNVECANEEYNINSVNDTVIIKAVDSSCVQVDKKKNNNMTINCGIDVSFGSNVPTPERLKDINQLEEKLASLKQFWDSK